MTDCDYFWLILISEMPGANSCPSEVPHEVWARCFIMNHLLNLFHVLVAKENAKEMWIFAPSQETAIQPQEKAAHTRQASPQQGLRTPQKWPSGRWMLELGQEAMGHLGKLRTWSGRRWDLGWIQKDGRRAEDALTAWQILLLKSFTGCLISRPDCTPAGSETFHLSPAQSCASGRWSILTPGARWSWQCLKIKGGG